MALADLGRKALGIGVGIIVLPAALLVAILRIPFALTRKMRAFGRHWLKILVVVPVLTSFMWLGIAGGLAIAIIISPLLVIALGYYSFAEKMRKKNYDLFSTIIATLTLGSIAAVGFLLLTAINFCVVMPLFFLPLKCMRVAEHEGIKAALELPVTIWDRLDFNNIDSGWPFTFIVWPSAAAAQADGLPRTPQQWMVDALNALIRQARSSAILDERTAAQVSLLEILTNTQNASLRNHLRQVLLDLRDPDTGASPRVVAEGLPPILAMIAQSQVGDAETEHQRCETEKALWKQESKAFNTITDAAEALRVPQPPPLTEGELNQFEAKILPTLSSSAGEMKSQCDAYREQMTCPIACVLAEHPVTVLLSNKPSNESKEETPSHQENKESKTEIPYKVYERVALKESIEKYIDNQVKLRSPNRDISEPTTMRDLNTLDILLSYPQSFEAFVGSVRRALTSAVEKTEQPVESSPRALQQASVIPHSIFPKPSGSLSPKASETNVPSHESPAPG